MIKNFEVIDTGHLRITVILYGLPLGHKKFCNKKKKRQSHLQKMGMEIPFLSDFFFIQKNKYCNSTRNRT